MLNDIFTAAGLPAQRGRFPDPPSQTYAIYFDSVEAEGPDGGPNRIFTHSITIELYAPSIEAGDSVKKKLEAEFDAWGLPYATQGWYWLSEIRRYQEIYEFTYIEKI